MSQLGPKAVNLGNQLSKARSSACQPQCWAPAQPQERHTRPNREYSQLQVVPVLHSDQPSLHTTSHGITRPDLTMIDQQHNS